MELIDYIDSDEGREDLTASVAVNVCENCGQACDELINLPTWNFKACATCAAEAAREDERDIRTDFVYPPIPTRNFDWAAWFDFLGAALPH